MKTIIAAALISAITTAPLSYLAGARYEATQRATDFQEFENLQQQYCRHIAGLTSSDALWLSGGPCIIFRPAHEAPSAPKKRPNRGSNI